MNDNENRLDDLDETTRSHGLWLGCLSIIICAIVGYLVAQWVVATALT